MYQSIEWDLALGTNRDSLMVLMHMKLFEFGFSFSFRVKNAEIGFEFLNEEFEV